MNWGGERLPAKKNRLPADAVQHRIYIFRRAGRFSVCQQRYHRCGASVLQIPLSVRPAELPCWLPYLPDEDTSYVSKVKYHRDDPERKRVMSGKWSPPLAFTMREPYPSREFCSLPVINANGHPAKPDRLMISCRRMVPERRKASSL